MELKEHWQSLYESSLERALQRINEVAGIVLGFHAVVDGLKKLQPGEVESVLENNLGLLDQVKQMADLPKEIHSPADFMKGLLSSMERGKALQLMIRERQTFDWLMENFGYDTPRMGGTSGNMANYLAPLGFRQILCYANPLPKQLAELFIDAPNLYVMAEDNRNYSLKRPLEAFQGEKLDALHWIGDYTDGISVSFGEHTFTTPRANRFIAAWNPINNKLQVSKVFQDGLLQMAGEFSHFIVSGFHILSESYPDGSTYRDCLKPVAAYLAQLTEQAPHLRLHYEFASIASPKIRKGIIDLILPQVHSLGLNEVELCAILRDLGDESLAAAVESGDAAAVLIAVKELMKHTGLPRIQLHDLGYYLCLVKKGFADPQRTLDGMLLAATLAASRSKTGEISSAADIPLGLEVPIYDKALAKLKELSSEMEAGDLEETGIASSSGYDVCFVPTKVVDKPVLTVALGDIISSSAFVTGT